VDGEAAETLDGRAHRGTRCVVRRRIEAGVARRVAGTSTPSHQETPPSAGLVERETNLFRFRGERCDLGSSRLATIAARSWAAFRVDVLITSSRRSCSKSTSMSGGSFVRAKETVGRLERDGSTAVMPRQNNRAAVRCRGPDRGCPAAPSRRRPTR
jgi:hypothetical protein